MVGFHLPFWRIDAEMLGRGGVHPIAYGLAKKIRKTASIITIVDDDLIMILLDVVA